MTTDFLIAMNAKDGTRETETVSSLQSAFVLIEEMAGMGNELVYVISVDFMEGERALNDVTDNVLEQLHEREKSRAIDRFYAGRHKGGHNFHSLDGYLKSTDWMWPDAHR